jgi:hypothetical protein
MMRSPGAAGGGAGAGDGVGVGVAVGDGVGVGVRVGDGVRVGVGVGVGVDVGTGVGDGTGAGVGDGTGAPVGDGSGVPGAEHVVVWRRPVEHPWEAPDADPVLTTRLLGAAAPATDTDEAAKIATPMSIGRATKASRREVIAEGNRRRRSRGSEMLRA